MLVGGHELHTLEVQNFRSFGAKKTIIDLRNLPGLSAIEGVNLDIPDEEAANGCGKSAFFVDALAFAFTGEPVKPVKRIAQLVNDVNEKNGLVAIQGVNRGELYRVERHIEPSKCFFYRRPVNAAGDIKSFNVTKDSIRQTEKDIEEFFGFDIDIFKLVFVTATKTDVFFGMESQTQKNVIEVLFGLELLSKKAAAIKADREQLETKLKVEKARVEERKASRERIERRFAEVQAASQKWDIEQTAALKELDETIEALEGIDFKAETALWGEIEKAIRLHEEAKKVLAEKRHTLLNRTEAVQTISARYQRAEVEVTNLKKTDFAALLKAFDEHEAAQRDITLLQTEFNTLNNEGRQLLAEEMRHHEAIENNKHSIEDLKGNCPTCKQPWSDQNERKQRIKEFEANIVELENAGKAVGSRRKEIETTLAEINAAIAELKKVTPPVSAFKKRDDALAGSTTLDQKQKALEDVVQELNEAKKQQSKADEQSQKADTECNDRRNQVTTLLEKTAFQNLVEVEFTARQLETLRTEKGSKSTAVNPHASLLQSLELELAEPVDGTALDHLDSEVRHHKYLEKQLGHKSSEIRRLITGKWLPKLNEYLTHYLGKLGLPYRVLFKDDLTAAIFNFEKEKAYSDLSSGEEERVIMALTLAFREVFEELHFPINFFIIDERLDVGLDGAGRQRCVNTLRDISIADRKPNGMPIGSVLMITHREEMKAHADRIITVTKKNRFSSISIRDDSMKRVA